MTTATSTSISAGTDPGTRTSTSARITQGPWFGLLVAAIAIAATAVSIPVLSASYDLFVPMSVLIATAHAVALVLATARPVPAIGLSGAAVLATAVLTVTSAGLPWPMPVPTMITQVLVCGIVALRGDPVTAVAGLAVSQAAAAAPLLVAVVQGDLWSVGFGNLVTFGTAGVLVTAAGLVASTILPRPHRPRG